MSKGSVAVVGTGIAGLSCAFLLGEEGYEVTLFEKQQEVGMDAHCVHVERNDGEMMRLNTPPRSFSRVYYPNLMEIYRASGVEIEAWNWAWAAFVMGDRNPFIRVDRTVRIMGYALPYIDLSRPFVCFQILYDGLRFSRAIARDYTSEEIIGMTLGDYLKQVKVSDAYIYHVLLPTLSMVCTCSYKSCLLYPVQLVMDFFLKTTTHGQFRTKFGTQDAVEHLCAKVVKRNLGVHVVNVHRADRDGKPTITYKTSYGGESIQESFDHIVMSTQANHALMLLENVPQEELDLLRAFPHETSQVVIHRDERVMPANRSKWAPMSVGILPDCDVNTGGSMFTIWMNDTFPDIKGNLFQTWNPVLEVDPATIIEKPITFERPVMTHKSLDAVAKLESIQGKGGIWFCGAWNCRRIPLQESGVASAVKVVRKLTKKKNLVAGKFVLDEDEGSQDKIFKDAELHETVLGGSLHGVLGLAFVASVAVAMVRSYRFL